MNPRSTSEHDPVDQLAEDFLTRYRRGERPSVNDYVQQFPDVADQVADVIHVLMLMENLGAGQNEQHHEAHPEKLGEYLIVRELGQGGMGVVYEAVQENLGRHVALKVLPAGALLKHKNLERFRRESKAAARLHHTNIVPVYGVGVQEGVHYYAMQYIQGQSLDVVVKEVKQQRLSFPAKDTLRDAAATTFHSNISGHSSRYEYARAVARIGKQIAEALAHAHNQGVLHRDIKPGNILIDHEGNAWLSDFGLAQIDASDQLTSAGDIVGTLRYMAPERFKQQGDARSDIYSLGMTLYEMLALQPAYEETNRANLIHQILKDEPASLRMRVPGLPRDLETIVLKAITKEPEHRYQTSQALADDLARFIVDRPVAARRLQWWERSWRWVLRNRSLSIMMALAFSVLIIGLATTYWQWQRAEAQAEEKRRSAETALQSQQKAEANAALAWRGFRGILEAMNYSSNKPLSELKRQILQQVLQLHEEYLQTVDDPPRLFEKGRIANELGKFWRIENDLINSEKHFLIAVQVYESLLQSQPDHPEASFELAITLSDLASMWKEKKPREALPCVMKSTSLLRTRVAAAPDVAFPRFRLAYNLELLAVLQKSDDKIWEPAIREAIQHLDQLMNVPPAPRVDHKVLHTRCKLSYAQLLQQHKRWPEARGMAEAALKSARSLARQFPKRDDFQEDVAECSTVLGHLLILLNEQPQAESLYRDAARIYESLLQHDPQNADVKKSLADILNKSGVSDTANEKK